MKRSLFLISFLFLLLTVKAQFLWQVYPDKIVKWNYFDGDEFNNEKVNTEKWHTHLPWSRAVISQDIYYKDENITFKNGNIQFALIKEDNYFPIQPAEIDTVAFKKEKIKLDNQKRFPFKYTGGLIYSKKDYKYGYFEIKFKAPEGQGIWPAFWLYGAKPNNEIDFFELKGEREDELHVDIHCPDGCGNYKEGPFGYRKSWGHWVKVDQKLKDGYNVIAGEWTKEYIKWYLNGILIAYSNHSFDLGMSLTAGTGIGKDHHAFSPGPNKNTPFPNIFNVDYIRVYKTDSLVNYSIIKNNLALTNDTLIEKTVNDHLAKKANKKLKNNPDKKVKAEDLITFSVMQIASRVISFRANGLNDNSKLKIKIKNSSGQIIRELEFFKNSEIQVSFSENTQLTISADINGRIFEEKIQVQ